MTWLPEPPQGSWRPDKVNTSIGVLKETMIETLAKDEHFEEALFEVSE